MFRPSRYNSEFLCALLRRDAEDCWARIERELGYNTFSSMVSCFGAIVDRDIQEAITTHGVTNLQLDQFWPMHDGAANRPVLFTEFESLMASAYSAKKCLRTLCHIYWVLA